MKTQDKITTEITYLKKSILLLRLEPVGAEKFETAGSLRRFETLVVTLQELEDVVDDDRLEVDLVLVVKIFRAKLDLRLDEKIGGKRAEIRCWFGLTRRCAV